MIHRYPRRLIPKHNYDLIKCDSFEEELKDFFLLRKIKRDENMMDFREMLKSQFLPTTFKNGISVVLLSLLRKEDICWCCKKPCGTVKGYEKRWEFNNRKAVFPKNKHLRYVKKLGFGGYKIGELYDYETEFPVKVKKNGKEEERKDIIKLRVEHEPLCSNFWHCEIFIYRINGDDNKELKLSNKEMERAGNLIIDDLADMARPQEETFSLYLKKSFYKARRV